MTLYTISESNIKQLKEGLFMATDVKKQDVQVENQDSLKGTLFSTIIFVGGGILFFIIVLFYFYMTRI